MSEERKPAPPITVAINRDLNNFLVRRQLLAMEGKRIQDLLLEAEGEVKANQDHLDFLRDTMFTAFRGLAETSKEKLKLKDLPKTTERFVRLKAKKLISDLRTGSAGTPAGSDAVRADKAGWHLPMARRLSAWADWFAEIDPTSAKASRFRKNRIQVALVVGGGMGDVLKSTHLAKPVSDHFSCDLTIITIQRAVGQIAAHNPYISQAIVPVTRDEFGLFDQLNHIPVFDLLILWRYNIHYVIPPESRLSHEEIWSIESGCSQLRQTLEKYRFSFVRHTFFFAFSRDMARLGLSAMKVSVETSGLRHGNPDQIPFFPSKQSLRVIAWLLTRTYITIHHGFDVDFLPARTRKTDYSSTKNISTQQWREIVSLIRNKGIEVIQLGTVAEERIEGVTHCLNGQTSLEEAGLLIKHSLCHIDTEGGLVHLANAVYARCVVLFGPTPAEFFGYPQNINLEPSGCKACWFATQNWLIECPRHTSGPECMAGHSAANVADAVDRIVAELEKLSAKLRAESQPSPTSLAEAVATARELLTDDARNRVLLILDDPPSDIGSQLSVCALDGSDVILCADDPPEVEPRDRVAHRLEYGSLLNLPRASGSIDTALLISRALESDIAPFALREIFRVLKPGGQLVFVAMGELTGLDLRRSLSAAQIAFDEAEVPSAPVYSCSLRKNGARGEGVPTHSRPEVSATSPQTEQGHGEAIDPRLARLEDENARQIALVRDTFARRNKIVDETWATKDSAVQRGFGGDGWIRIPKNSAEVYPGIFFIKGWHEPSDSVIWSRGERCFLMLPLPEDQSPPGNRLELQLHVAVPEASAANPATVGLRVDEGPIENYRLSSSDAILTVISANASKFRGVSLVEIRFDAERGREEGDEARPSLRAGVFKFRYRVLVV